MAAGLSESADPGWLGPSAWGSVGERVQELGGIQAQGKTKAEARGRGLGGSVGIKVSAGGAVGAVLGGRGAGRALKWEFIVFLKENIGFSRSGELPGAPKTGVWASSGALGGASGRSPGVVGRVLGARGSVRGAPREVFGALGSSFQRSGTTLGDFGADFLGS